MVLFPCSLAVVFNLIVSGHANNYLVNKVSRALISWLVVRFAGEILQDTTGFDIYKLFEDLFDSEKFFNPDITSVKVNINGVPNKLHSQGMEMRNRWEEVLRHFVKCGALGYNDSMDATKFYTDKFGMFIDLRTMSDDKLHGSGLRLLNTKDGVQLEIERTGTVSGTVKCHIFIISDAQFNIMNNELDAIEY